jgi:hypothetical protein
MGTIPRPKGFPIEGKKHMKELKNKSIWFSMLCPDPLFSAISSCNESTYCSDSNSWNCY